MDDYPWPPLLYQSRRLKIAATVANAPHRCCIPPYAPPPTDTLCGDCDDTSFETCLMANAKAGGCAIRRGPANRTLASIRDGPHVWSPNRLLLISMRWLLEFAEHKAEAHCRIAVQEIVAILSAQSTLKIDTGVATATWRWLFRSRERGAEGGRYLSQRSHRTWSSA